MIIDMYLVCEDIHVRPNEINLCKFIDYIWFKQHFNGYFKRKLKTSLLFYKFAFIYEYKQYIGMTSMM